ncbi:EAL domain-containing protein [Chromatiaceae bacterium AAb-1]|nr:EAL domain-containing protein [Chromatiaceae bacterium AAb-1]
MPDSCHFSQIFIQTLEQAIDGVVVIDSENRIIFLNKAAEQLWGYSKSEAIGQNVKLLVPENIRQQHDSYIYANRNTGINKIVGTSRDVPIEHKDGSRKWGSMSISKITTDGQILYTAFIKDVTRQHEDNERIRLLSMVADQTGSAIIITDDKWRIVYVNSGFSSLFGYSLADVAGKLPSVILASNEEPQAISVMQQCLTAGQAYKSDELVKLSGGERIWCNITANPVMDHNHNLINTIAVMVDITQSKIHETLQHKLLEAMVHEQPLESLMELACLEIERIVPEVTASILKVDDDGSLHPLAAPGLPVQYCQALEGAIAGPAVGSCGTAAFRGETVVVTDIATDPLWQGYSGLVLPLGLQSCWSIPIKSSNNRVLGTLAFYYREKRAPALLHQQLADVIVSLCALALEREESRAHIRQLAFYDSLTDLPNRSLLHANAEHALFEARRKKQPLAVLFIDLDRFKHINDTLGHAAGDELLQLVAQRLQHNRRHADIVGRLSGDEFVIVLPQCGSEHVTELAEKLRAAISNPCQIAARPLIPSASIGISIFPQDGHDIGTLLHRAETAMYQAKHSGRGRFSFFSHELNQLAQKRQALESALRYALEHNELKLHYQPQVRMKDGLLYGVEALARWQHTEFGDVSPTCFIPLAEECGLINELGMWAIKEACRQLAAWRRQGLKIPAVSVNLSPTNFHNLDLPGVIAATLNSYQLTARDLTLELTESVLMDTNPGTMKTLNEVHAQGIKLAMDDFGTGYSSLSYLRRLPIQELKLDRSFVQDLEVDTISQALSDAVIRIGESLQLTVVAEGIEEDAQYRILHQQGYHVAQGYLFSRALSAAELEAWLKSGEVWAG